MKEYYDKELLLGTIADNCQAADDAEEYEFWDRAWKFIRSFPAADAIEELSRENESLGKSVCEGAELVRKLRKTKWIPITERLPKDNERVLIARVIGKNEPLVVQQAFRSSNGWWKVFGTSLRDKSVKFWMPMPEPPKEVEE